MQRLSSLFLNLGALLAAATTTTTVRSSVTTH